MNLYISRLIDTWPLSTAPAELTQAENSVAIADEAKNLVNFLNNIPFPYAATAPQVRAMRAAANNSYDFPVIAESFVATENIVITTQNANLNARVYRPINALSSSPCFVFYHGGGFVLGDLDSYHNTLCHIAEQSNVIIVSVEYRLAPESPFPQPVEDAYNSYQWLRQNANSLGIDRSRMAIGGDSAGGNLATVVCHQLRDQGKPLPKLQILIYPSVAGNDISLSRKAFGEGYLLTTKLLQWFHDLYLQKAEESDPRFNVLNYHSHKKLPPAFIMTAGFDPLRDEGFEYAQALKRDGVAVCHRCYADMFHGFYTLGKLPQAQRAVTETALVLRKAFWPWWRFW